MLISLRRMEDEIKVISQSLTLALQMVQSGVACSSAPNLGVRGSWLWLLASGFGGELMLMPLAVGDPNLKVCEISGLAPLSSGEEWDNRAAIEVRRQSRNHYVAALSDEDSDDAETQQQDAAHADAVRARQWAALRRLAAGPEPDPQGSNAARWAASVARVRSIFDAEARRAEEVIENFRRNAEADDHARERVGIHAPDPGGGRYQVGGSSGSSGEQRATSNSASFAARGWPADRELHGLVGSHRIPDRRRSPGYCAAVRARRARDPVRYPGGGPDVWRPWPAPSGTRA